MLLLFWTREFLLRVNIDDDGDDDKDDEDDVNNLVREGDEFGAESMDAAD